MTTAAAESELPPSRLNRLLGPYQVLRGRPNLALLFGGQVVSALGDWLYITVLVVLVYQITGSATLAAAVTAVRLLPYALFLPLSGVLADRFDRRRLMVTADLGRALCMLGLLAVTSRQTVWLAFPLVFASTCLFSLFRPALGAMLPAVAGGDEHLAKANTLMSQIDGLAIVLGPGLAGILILLGIGREAFAINAVTYGVSTITLLRMRLPSRPPRTADETGRWLVETLTGFRFLWRQKEGALAAVTFTTASLAVFNGALWTLAVVLSKQTWHFGTQGAGFLTAAVGAGGLLGGFLVTAIAGKLRPPAGYILPVASAGLMMVLFGLCPANLLPFGFLALFGVFDVFNQVDSTTIIQLSTPDEMLGRVFGAFEATIVGTVLIGALATGPLIAQIGPRATSVVAGLLTLAVLLVALPRLRALRPDADERREPQPARAPASLDATSPN